MAVKIILVVILIIGALITYMSEKISEFVCLSKEPQRNNVLVKVIGLIIVLFVFVITFLKF